MQQKDRLALDNQLCFSLYATSLTMTQWYKPLLDPLGLTYTQYLIMLILWQNNGIGLKEIANRLGQRSGALTPVVKRMADDGLLLRSRCADDERALIISLTDKGKALQRDAAEVNRCMAERCGMPEGELYELKLTLDRLRKNLAERA